MKWALKDSDNIVQNLIVYDGSSKYNPAPFLLVQVNDWINIGDNVNDPEPPP